MTKKIKKLCKTCGKQILNANKKYCSPECDKHYRHVTPIEGTCLICSQHFPRKGKYVTKYCSPKCKREAQGGRDRDGISARVKHICAKCGKEYVGNNKAYCSRDCYSERHHRTGDGGQPEKRCTKCGEWKPQTFEYYGHASICADGFSCYCKACGAASIKTPEYITKRKIYRARPHVQDKTSKYGKTRKAMPEVKEKRRIDESTRSKTDPTFALKNRVRILMYHSLRGTKNGRKWQDLVGYSADDLRQHIQKKFKDGMTWDKFMAGEIHIDHRIPVAAFNFTSPEDLDFQRCWSMKNLQPLWAEDNLKKSAKIDRPFQPALHILQGGL